MQKDDSECWDQMKPTVRMMQNFHFHRLDGYQVFLPRDQTETETDDTRDEREQNFTPPRRVDI